MIHATKLVNESVNSCRFQDKNVWRIVKKLCLGVDVAETEDEKFGVVDSV